MLRMVFLAEAFTVVIGLMLFAFLAIALGQNPVPAFDNEASTLFRVFGDVRLAPYGWVFCLYLALLPVMLALVRKSMLARVLLSVLGFCLMHLAFYALQFVFPLSGYEELVLILCTVIGFFWIVAGIGGTMLAERMVGTTRG